MSVTQEPEPEIARELIFQFIDGVLTQLNNPSQTGSVRIVHGRYRSYLEFRHPSGQIIDVCASYGRRKPQIIRLSHQWFDFQEDVAGGYWHIKSEYQTAIMKEFLAAANS
jgi:hypothetical protein